MTKRYMILGAVLLAGLLFIFFRPSGEGDGEQAKRSAESDAGPVVVAGDSRGALVLKGSHLVGYHRDGTQAWRVDLADRPFEFFTCAGACPDAVLSGNQSAQSDSARDLRPLAIGSGSKVPQQWLAKPQLRAQILGITSSSALRFAASRPDQGAWQVTTDDRTRSTPAPGRAAAWLPASGGLAGVALIYDKSRNAYLGQAFASNHGQWSLLGSASINPRGGAACVSSDGRYWFSDGETIHEGHKTVALQKPADGGNCAFTDKALVVADYTRTGNASSTGITVLDLASGREMWSKSYDRELSVSADAKSGGIVLSGGSGPALVLNASGAVKSSLAGVPSATFDGSGSLILVDEAGKPRWVAPK